MQRFPGEESTVLNEEDRVHYPNEFSNNLSISGFPAHMSNFLALGVGVSIILKRDLTPPHCVTVLSYN